MSRSSEGQEQRLLLLSAAATLLLSVVGVMVGLWTGTKSLVFDGMYSVVDAGMTLISWFAARLIARGSDARFQYGYWHFEPMLAFLNGAMLLVACIYGALNGFGALLSTGRVLPLDGTIPYAAGATVFSLSFYQYLRSKGRGLNSTLLRIDTRSWLVSAILGAGLGLSFSIARAMKHLGAEGLAAFVDPVALIVLAISLTPLPVTTLLKAGRELLQIAPDGLHSHVSQIATDVSMRHGFIECQTHVTQVGRAQFIEIAFVASEPESGTTFGKLDAIRGEIAEALNATSPNTWLTVTFTADRRWA